MKSNRDLVLELLLQVARTGEHPDGLSTQYMAQRLDIQRTNLSSVLNALVRDKKLEKVNGRPVLYRLAAASAADTLREDSCFATVPGPKKQLYPAIQLIKAAELYPGSPIPILVTGPVGCGKSYFIQTMHRFACENKVLPTESVIERLDCADSLLNLDKLHEQLFDSASGLVTNISGRMIVLEHADVLPASELDHIRRILQSKECGLLVGTIDEAAQDAAMQDQKTSFFPARIRMPALSEWALSDRLDVIRSFFNIEAGHVGKKITAGSELLTCLLLYPCRENVRQLHADIRMGCANAYMRGRSRNADTLVVTTSDMPDNVRRGLLSIRDHGAELEELIPQNYTFTFTANGVKAAPLESVDIKDNLYEYIDARTNELLQRGIPPKEVNELMVLDIGTQFANYSGRLARQVVNKGQLAKLVDERLIRLVGDFLKDAEARFARLYPAATFYGLCLHLNGCICPEGAVERSLTSDQLLQIINNHKSEYAYASLLVSRIEKEFHVSLRPEETAFIALFLCEDNTAQTDRRHPGVLLAMHGRGTASGIASVVQAVSGGEIAAYDMDLDKDMQAVYTELKNRVLECDAERGILAIYDMGSFKHMFEMIQQECGIVIYAIQVPLTLMAIEAARLAPTTPDLASLRQTLAEAFQDVSALSEGLFHRSTAGRVILTCCMSGQGGAIVTKQYLEKHLELDDVDVIPLAISDRKLLLQEIARIREKHQILCLVGVYDPQIYGLPFFPVNEIYTTELSALADQLHLKVRQQTPGSEIRRTILDHLKSEFHNIDGEKMEKQMMRVMEQLRRVTGSMGIQMALEQEVGLMVHIACCAERLAGGAQGSVNRFTSEILQENSLLYQHLLEVMHPLEISFGIQLPKDEYANMISIIQKIQK